MEDSVSRFTTRVDDYVRCRPTYPRAAIARLEGTCGLAPGVRVADLGSGTGLFTRLLLDAGAEVFAVEPNEAMREAAERALGGRPGFHGVAARAEATGLADGSMGLVTAAQSFHWFDQDAARREFARILAPGGWAAVVWNHRPESGTPFFDGYEKLLLEFANDYRQVSARYADRARMAGFFAPAAVEEENFRHAQTFDFEGLRGRLLSSSYAPRPGESAYAPMMAALERLFEEHERGGRVRMEYECRLYFGRIG